MKELTGRIFNIQKCSIRDGRGMRTTVFLKGCGLRCLWCANPEGISFAPEISLNPVNCMGCGFCLKQCPSGAVSLDEKGVMKYDRLKCAACGLCAQLCPTEARKKFGQEYTVDELFRRIYQDHFYFEHSGGGVTFSGGEALMHEPFDPEFYRLFFDSPVNCFICLGNLRGGDRRIKYSGPLLCSEFKASLSYIRL